MSDFQMSSLAAKGVTQMSTEEIVPRRGISLCEKMPLAAIVLDVKCRGINSNSFGVTANTCHIPYADSAAPDNSHSLTWELHLQND